jgi:hypothetical protein
MESGVNCAGLNQLSCGLGRGEGRGGKKGLSRDFQTEKGIGKAGSGRLVWLCECGLCADMLLL